MNDKIKQILNVICGGILLIGSLILIPYYRSVLDPQMPSENPDLTRSMWGFFGILGIISIMLIGMMLKLKNDKQWNSLGGSELECESTEVMQ